MKRICQNCKIEYEGFGKLYCSKSCKGKSLGYKKGAMPWSASVAGTGMMKAWNKGKSGDEVISSNGYNIKNIDGKYKQVHRWMMEQIIGRELKKCEIVHHWDENRLNNNPENLALLRGRGAHQRLHFFADRHGLQVSDLRFEQPWLTNVS